MNLMKENLTMKWNPILMLSLILAWSAGIPLKTFAEDSHAGHDHAAHEEESVPAKHAEAPEQVEHAEDEVHEEHPEDEAHGSVEGEHDEAEADEHDDEEEDRGLRLSAEQMERFGIVVSSAEAGHLHNEVRLPGEIVFNEDQVVHMVPRVGGMVREVHKSIGDRVQVGDVMAVLESRELADAKSAFLTAQAHSALAEKTFVREKSLHEKQVSSELEYLEAEQALAEARIELRAQEQKLRVLGLSAASIQSLESEPDASIAHYELRSPISGVVTEKHITLGESLEADADIFTVADMSRVWVNLTVYIKNLGVVQAGQSVTLQVDHSGAQAKGTIDSVTPFVEEATRSATARVVLENSDGRWMPGTFVTGFSRISEEDVPVVVPREAVQTIDDRQVVFIEHEGTYEMVTVTPGRVDRNQVEITSGLEQGMRYVSEGAFQLKATIITSNLGSHAGHGH